MLWQAPTWLLFYVLSIPSVAGDFINRSLIAGEELSPLFVCFLSPDGMLSRAGGFLGVPSSKMRRLALSPCFQAYCCIFISLFSNLLIFSWVGWGCKVWNWSWIPRKFSFKISAQSCPLCQVFRCLGRIWVLFSVPRVPWMGNLRLICPISVFLP